LKWEEILLKLIWFALTLCLFTANTLASESPSIIFEKFWQTAEQQVFPEILVEQYFSDEEYQRLRKSVSSVTNTAELTPLFNEFLKKLNVSHTQFYDDQTVDYYLFRSMFGTKDIANPKVNHIGAQYVYIDGNYIIREILDEYPAAKAGLRRGDKIKNANSIPFHPFHAFNPSANNVKLGIERNGVLFEVTISAVRENPNESFSKAIANSTQIFDKKNYRLGYLRLWAGTHRNNIGLFRKMMTERLADTDGMILDLRGGFGGAWYDYLDSFFADRSDYFDYSVHSREGVSEFSADKKQNKDFYVKPMVVLINQGTRSGKEALAYQFKKSKRATLVGETTQGAFSAGKGIFNKASQPYFLFLSTAEFRLDGIRIEGVGINPDIRVEYKLSKSPDSDPQLKAAQEEVIRLLSLAKNS